MNRHAALPLVLLALHACAPVDEADPRATAADAIINGRYGANQSTYVIRRGPNDRCVGLMISADQALVAHCVNPDTRPADLSVFDGTATIPAAEIERHPATGLAVVRFPGMRNVTPGRVGRMPVAGVNYVTCTGFTDAGYRNAGNFTLYTLPGQNLFYQLRGWQSAGVQASDLGGPCDIPDLFGRNYTVGLLYGVGACNALGCSVGGTMLGLNPYVTWIRDTARLQRLRATSYGFSLVNPASGRCVSLRPWRDATIEPCDGSARQRFYADPIEGSPGAFHLVEGATGALAAESWTQGASRLSTDEGSWVTEWALPGGAVGPVQAIDAQACLDIPGSAAAPSGTALQLFACHGGANQQWVSRWHLTRPAS